MNQLYWLTRVGNINAFFFVLFIVSIIVFVIYAVISLIVYIDDREEGTTAFKKLKIAIISTIVTGTICCFIPTTKEMFMIYGVGGTIDYLKSNDTAKQIPDKCINALDKFIDEYVNDDNNEKKDNKEE